MAKFLNTILNDILVSLQTDYNVYEVFDVEDANVVLNDVQEESFPIAFFSIKNNATLTLDRHKKTYPSYSIAVWLLNLYEEDNKSELETNYEGLRLDAMEFVQRFQRVEEFSRVPSNLTISPNIEEFDSNLDLLATALQISFTASVDIGEDTSRVCAPLNVSSFTVDDSDLDNVVLDASASSFRGVTSGATGGVHAWGFTLDTTTINISGLATESLSISDIALLATIGMDSATGTYNSFTFVKNSLFSIPLNFIISVSHTYDFRNKGVVSDATIAVINRRVFAYLETTHDTNTDGNFILVILTLSETGTWVLPDSSTITNNTLNTSNTSIDGSLRSITLLIPNFDNIKSIDFDGMKLAGKLSLSPITALNGDLSFRENSDITEFDLGVGSHIINNLLISDTGLNTFDASLYGITHSASGILQFTNCPNLTYAKAGAGTLTNVTGSGTSTNLLTLDLSNVLINGIVTLTTSSSLTENLIFSTLNNTITQLVTRAKAFSILDFSNVEFTGLIDYRNCLSLNSVTHKVTAQTINSDYLASNCNLSSLDLSMFTVNGSVQVRNNSNLSSFSIGSGTISTFLFFDNCSLTAIDLGNIDIDGLNRIEGQNNGAGFPINDVLTQLDSLSVSGSGVIDLGGSNLAPTGTGLTAKMNLIVKGWTVNTN